MTGQGKSAIDTLLAESFKELALKQPIEKITIKEITDKAGVIRPTFYNHFQDKYDLLEWIIDKELLEPVEPLIQNGMINEALVLLFSGIEREKEFYTKASRLEGQNSFGSIAQSCVERVLLQVIKGQAEGRKSRYVWLTPERIAEYYAQSHVLCGDHLDQVRNDDIVQGTCGNLQLYDQAVDDGYFVGTVIAVRIQMNTNV